MDAWQPLAPTQRASAMYSRAPELSGGGSFPQKQPAFRRASRYGTLSNGRDRVGKAAANAGEGNALARIGSSSDAASSSTGAARRRTEPPSDPFPPVGRFPRAVAVRTLSFLPIANQAACALAGRSLAGAVADEGNWSRRLDALDWCQVDGLSVKFDQRDSSHAESERSSGRRRKGKAKETASPAPAHTYDQLQRSREQDGLSSAKDASFHNKGQADDDDDDFGDFAESSSAARDSAFADVSFERAAKPSGGSLASGLASVALGAGHPHNLASTGAPSFTPLSPSKQGAATSQKDGSIFSFSTEARLPRCDASPSFRILRAYAGALRPFIKSLADTSGSSTSSLIFTCDLGLASQAALLSNLLRYISTSVGGYHHPKSRRSSEHSAFEDENSLSYRGQEAANHLLQTLLSSFQGTSARRSDAVRAASHGADTTRAIRRAEDDMKSHANCVWELGNARLALAMSERDEFSQDYEDEFGRMKAAKLLLEQLSAHSTGLKAHDPLDNVPTRHNGATLDFTAMDRFISDISDGVRADGSIIARVFPPEQDVLLAFAGRIANEVVAAYIRSLLQHTKSISTHLYLRSCAASFAQAWNLVEVLMSIEPRDEEIVTRTRCEDIMLFMWDENMDEYLQDEKAWARDEMQNVTEKWESDLKNHDSAQRVDAAFLNSQNPAAVKRSVLTGFKDVLLLPVTVVPRTVGTVGGAVFRTAGTGLSSLNPRRWQSGGAAPTSRGALGSSESTGPVASQVPASPRSPITSIDEKGYIDFSHGAVGTMDSDDDEQDDPAYDSNEKDEWNEEVEAWSAVASARPEGKRVGKPHQKHRSIQPLSSQSPSRSSTPTVSASTATTSTRASTPASGAKANVTQMQLLLSLDTALQVIHVNRDCLKRIETFKKYPSPHGEEVRNAIQEVSLMLFRALGDGHVAPGFAEATKRIVEWKPEERDAANSSGKDGQEEPQVEPLVHFFELVHVGDTIAQMVQVYFDEEISKHIDKNDFMNAVVKGKKRFESNLDEVVAKGLNAGVDVLLGQAEHILATKQRPKDFCPDKGVLTDLSPTPACREAVDCLRLHCKMLVGAADKNVLEVFYQEVGIRLHGIICKYLKKQIVSLDGGFRLIADLNEYHAFIATLRQPTLTADFDALKMLGNLFIIDNPRELAKLARDATNFGGALSPEDLYEFLQARADFRAIEKAVDKEMYGFKVSEDCQVM